jgi:hypothetical protein
MSYSRKETVVVECTCDFCKRSIDTSKPWIRASFCEIRDEEQRREPSMYGAGDETILDLHPSCESMMRQKKPEGTCVAFGCYNAAEYAQFCLTCIKAPA